ncbi:MAG TPA: hypothetical protein K8V84_10825 [Nocardiopsis listeri]|uniref:hypothetical protein n=1 Tax=Nocardiopsis listeri TaxID=53440 RepID=UPI001DB649A1|nr:hypothetical protein [Nocardiopsis listeri]HJE58983.1 hypothetical protein [Nocardiopsis listeri]
MAAFVGVAATGVAIARAERQRRAYTPEQVRDRLHARAAEIGQGEGGGATAPGTPEEGGEDRSAAGRVWALWRRLSRTARRRIGRSDRSDRRGDRPPTHQDPPISLT